MKKRKRWPIAAVVAVTAAIALAFVLGPRTEEIVVQMSMASTGSLEERSDGSGVLEGVTLVEISAARGGLVDSVAVEAGDTVRAGGLLLVLDREDALAGLNEAWAEVSSAQIALDQAGRAAERTEALWAAGLASDEENTLAAEEVRSCRASLTRADASAAMAADDLSETTYYSPIDGVVTEVNVEVGEMAVTGTMNNAGTVLITVEDISSFLVRTTMVESEIVDVQEGMTAEVTLDALPDTVFTGVVETVGLSSSNDAGGEEAAEYEVLVRIDSPDPRMRSGMSASVEIVTARSDSCVTVPIQAIVRRADPGDPSRTVPCVLTVENGCVRAIPVETGITGVMEIEVEGVASGTGVISGPTELLRTLQDGDSLDSGDEENADGSDTQSGMPGPGAGMPGGSGGAGPGMPPGGR